MRLWSKAWRTTAISAICIAVGLTAVERPSAASTEQSTACRPDQLLKDYLAPLSDVTARRGFSPSGHLDIGPSTLRVLPPKDRLQVTKSALLSALGRISKPSSSNRSLNLTVLSKLIRVDGHHSQVLATKTQFIATVPEFGGRQFGFKGFRRPGIYRLDVRFSTPDGSVDHRSELFRVVMPVSHLELSVSPGRLQPAGSGYLQILNYGTVDATFSYLYSLKRADSGEPVDTGPQIVPQVRPLVRAGKASQCFEVVLPADLTSGEYEVGVYVKDLSLTKPIRVWQRLVVEQ
mgnify:CR=1 FL=1